MKGENWEKYKENQKQGHHFRFFLGRKGGGQRQFGEQSEPSQLGGGGGGWRLRLELP